jgi:hypothetical protein
MSSKSGRRSINGTPKLETDEVSAAQKIIDGLKDAINGNITAVHIDGVTWRPEKVWQPISTAPKDSEFLVWHRGSIRQVQLYDSLHTLPNAVIDPLSGRIWGATHWMPLPSPPSQDSEAGK